MMLRSSDNDWLTHDRNHWTVDQTGLGDLQASTFNYMTFNWMPRGAETALLVYGATSGWVTHDEMNLFGHTGYGILFRSIITKLC
jgi:hypothetical protein